MDDIVNYKNNDTLEDIVFNTFDDAEDLRYVTMDSYDMRIGMCPQPVITEIMEDHLRKSSSEIINETTASTSTNPIQLNNQFLSNQPVATNASDKLENIIKETLSIPSNQSEKILNYERLLNYESIPTLSNSNPTAATSNEVTYQMLSNMVGKFRNWIFSCTIQYYDNDIERIYYYILLPTIL